MGILIRFLAVCALIWALFVHFKETKSEEKLRTDQIELKAYQEGCHDAKKRYEKAAERRDTLRHEVKLMQREAQNLRKKLTKKREEDKEQQQKMERDNQERARQEHLEEQERARQTRYQQERDEKEATIRLERAREKLFRMEAAPRHVSIPSREKKSEKIDFGMMEKIDTTWSMLIRKIITESRKGDSKKLQALTKRLSKLADKADNLLKGTAYTQRAEETIQAVSDILQATKVIERRKKEKSQVD